MASWCTASIRIMQMVRPIQAMTHPHQRSMDCPTAISAT